MYLLVLYGFVFCVVFCITAVTKATAANLHHSPELGHIHRGGSCTEKSTFPGYIVSGEGLLLS